MGHRKEVRCQNPENKVLNETLEGETKQKFGDWMKVPNRRFRGQRVATNKGNVSTSGINKSKETNQQNQGGLTNRFDVLRSQPAEKMDTDDREGAPKAAYKQNSMSSAVPEVIEVNVTKEPKQ